MEHLIKIENLNHQGQGIGRINDKIIFVSKTIPDDLVKIKIIKDNKKYYEGKVINFNKRNNCIEYSCPYYLECGGCHIANLEYNKQLEYKKDKVKNILKKYCQIDVNINIVPSDKELSYRNKVTFHVDKYLGYYMENSNNLIKIDKCLLLSDKMNNLIDKINKLDLSKVSKVVIREINDKIMVAFYGEVKPNINVDSIYLNNNFYSGKEYLQEKINDYQFVISNESFFQVNKNVTEKLYQQVLSYCGNLVNKKVLDLYCGTGTIGISISLYAKEVLGIEINDDAIKDANINKEINNINNISFIKGKVEEVLNDDKVDIVIVDPPRSGLDKITKNKLLKIEADTIIYVSCDPMTLARDINDLKEKYYLKDITLFDMFPQTYHVESVCILKKDK